MEVNRTNIRYIYSLESEDCENVIYLNSVYDVVLYLQSEEAFLPVTIDRLEVFSLEEVKDEPTH